MVSAIEGSTEVKNQDQSGLPPSNRLPPLSSKSTMLGGPRGSRDGLASANGGKKKARSRSRSPAPIPIGNYIDFDVFKDTEVSDDSEDRCQDSVMTL